MTAGHPHRSGCLALTRLRDEGSATVLVLGLLAAVLSLLLGALEVARAVVTGHRAAAAADLAALAAAQERTAGNTPAVCSAAGRVAALNGANLTRCTARADGSVVVHVVVVSEAPWSMTATAHARAGPADSPAGLGRAGRRRPRGRARSPT